MPNELLTADQFVHQVKMEAAMLSEALYNISKDVGTSRVDANDIVGRLLGALRIRATLRHAGARIRRL